MRHAAAMTPRLLLLALLGITALGSQRAQLPALEPMLLVPEPKAMRSERSLQPEGAKLTVWSPAREIKAVPGLEVYDAQAFAKLGIGPQSFALRAKSAADRLLAALKPEVIRRSDGSVAYAVYRSDRPIMACLLVAPKLPEVFRELFGPEIWVAAPDRHSLFVFAAMPEAIEEFTEDLAQRFREDAHAASPEVFALREGAEPRVVAAFAR